MNVLTPEKGALMNCFYHHFTPQTTMRQQIPMAMLFLQGCVMHIHAVVDVVS